jgi:hypothetical protein
MAVLTTSNVAKVFENGLSDCIVLYALRKVSSADTFDVGADFSSPKLAHVLGTTVLGQASVVTITGTVVTLPAGLASDAGYMLVWGAKA